MIATSDCLEGIYGCILVSDGLAIVDGIGVRVKDGFMAGIAPS